MASITISSKPAPPRAWTMLRGRGLSTLALGALGLGAFLGLWQLLVATGILDPIAVPTMVTAFRWIIDSLHTTLLWRAVGQTLEGTAIGFAIGSVAGVLVGTLVGLNKYVYASCFLVIEFFKTIPIIVLIPLSILIWGTSLHMKIILITFGLFFPIAIQTIYGVRSVDPVVRDTAQVFRLSRIQNFVYVTMPSAAPYIATGLRLGATGALLLDVTVELTSGAGGLGLQLLQSEAGDAIGYSYALLIITGVVGMLLVLGVSAIERRVMYWHDVYRKAS
jgi:ABC-type nitrate/sulfonate/bicarbonate transport system permease component